MKKQVAAVAMMILLFAIGAMAQGSFSGAPPQNQAAYGFTAWGINGQRVASQYNYVIDTRNGLGSALGLFTFPTQTCNNVLVLPGRGGVNPINFTDAAGALPQVRVVDNTSANSETVSQNSAFTTSGAYCTFNLATSNTHTQGSYYLTSPTCGLREALDDLGTAGGEVIIDSEWYALPQGCTKTTITALSGQLLNNQFIHDISNGQDTWYTIQPSTLSALAVPTASANLTCATTAGLVCQSATTGGSWPNSAEHVGDIYVDALGGWSVASVDHSLTPSASGTNVLQFNSPAASTGAVGWLPFGGLAYNSTTYVLPVTSANCTLSTLFTAYPICAIGSAATITAPVTTTSLIPQSGGIAAAYNPNPQSHTTMAYRPSQRPGYPFQSNYGPFTACPALTAGQLCVLGTVQLPTGFLQNLGIGGTMRFSGDVTLTPSTGGTIGIDTEIGDITDFSTGTPKIVCTEGETTATGTAAIKVHFDCSWVVNAIGTTGTLMPGGFFMEQLQAGTTTGNLGVESATAAITADILDQDSIYFVFLQTSAAESTTPPQLMNLKIEVLNN